jgi:hypothetical protein
VDIIELSGYPYWHSRFFKGRNEKSIDDKCDFVAIDFPQVLDSWALSGSSIHTV